MASAERELPEARTGRVTSMSTASSHDLRTRRPVFYRGEKVHNLTVRTTSDGREIYEVRRKVGGRSKRVVLAAQTVTDAVREATRTSVGIEDSLRLVGDTRITLGELRDAFKDWAESSASTLSANTRANYLGALDTKVLPILGRQTKVANVTTAHIRTLIDKLISRKLAGSTVRANIAAASALFRYAVRRGIIPTNPVRGLERGERPSGKRTTEPRYLDRLQIDQLLGKLSETFRPIAATLAFAGLRVSEALALTWADVDFDNLVLHVRGTKTVASRADVPLAADLARELKAHRSRLAEVDLQFVRPGALLFTQSRRNALRAIYAAGTQAGLNPDGVERVSCHDLRHSCAGLLFAAGLPAPAVSSVLRHADVRITLSTYAGLAESDRAGLRTELEAALAAK
jgi:integrase